jgi:hypothetical protein
MDLMKMVGEMTLISLAEVAVSHGSLEAAVRSTLHKQHQFRIQIQVGVTKKYVYRAECVLCSLAYTHC